MADFIMDSEAKQSGLKSLADQITKQTTSASTNSSVVNSSPVNRVAKVAGLCVWNANMNLKATATTSTVIATLPSGYRPACDVRFAGRRGSAVDMFTINTNGELMTLLNSANNGDYISFSVAFDV